MGATPRIASAGATLVAARAGPSAAKTAAPQHRRIPGQRARHRDPLLLATRQRGRKVLEPIAETDRSEKIGAAVAAADELGDQRHVLTGRQRRDEVEELEHEPDARSAELRQPVGVEAGQILTRDPYGAFGGSVDPADDVEQRRLARPARPQEDDELSGADRQVNASERVDGHVALAEAASDTREFDGRVGT
jgi:hypothetical protein